MNFVIYHSALRPFLELPDQAWAEFESTGRIRWASDLAEIPQKFGVTNVHAELARRLRTRPWRIPNSALPWSAR